MPAYQFNTSGVVANTTNITLSAAGTVNYVIKNNTGSAALVEIDRGTGFTVFTITRNTGAQEVLSVTGANFIDLNGDESVFLTITGTSGAGWRVNAADTKHGLSAGRGRGHTTTALNTSVGGNSIIVATI